MPTATSSSRDGCVPLCKASLVRGQRAFPDVGSATGNSARDYGGYGSYRMKAECGKASASPVSQRAYSKWLPLAESGPSALDSVNAIMIRSFLTARATASDSQRTLPEPTPTLLRH